MKALILALSLIALSCAPRGIVAPPLMQLGQTTAKSSEVLQSQSRAILEQKRSINESLVKAEVILDKVIKDIPVLREDVTPLIDSIKTTESRNLFLEQSNTELVTLNNDQKESLNEAVKESQDLSKALEKEKIKSASSGVYKRWVIAGAIAIGLYILVPIILKAIKPL